MNRLMHRPMGFRLAALAFLAVLSLATPSLSRADDAQDLASAKSAGRVGERADGMIGAVSASDAALQALISRINDARLAAYHRIAADSAAPLAAVQSRAGTKLTSESPSGSYVMGADGQWRRK